MRAITEAPHLDLARAHYCAGASGRTIARRLGISHQAVHVRLRKFRAAAEEAAGPLWDACAEEARKKGYCRVPKGARGAARCLLGAIFRARAEEGGFLYDGRFLFDKEEATRRIEEAVRLIETEGLPAKIPGTLLPLPASGSVRIFLEGGTAVGIGAPSASRVTGRNLSLYAKRYGRPFGIKDIRRLFPSFARHFRVPAKWLRRTAPDMVQVDYGRVVHLGALLKTMGRSESGRRILSRLVESERLLGGEEMKAEVFFEKVLEGEEAPVPWFTPLAAADLAERLGGCRVNLRKRTLRPQKALRRSCAAGGGNP